MTRRGQRVDRPESPAQASPGRERLAPGLEALARPLADLGSDPRNARRHDDRNLAAIRRSLELYGQRRPLVVRAGVVIVGNGTLAAMRALGWTRAAVVDADDLSEREARGYALADNRTTDLSGWDADVLADELRELGAAQVEPPGWSAAELADLTPLPHEAERAATTEDDAEVIGGAPGAAYELKDDWRPPTVGRWELPALRADRLLPPPDLARLPEVACPGLAAPGGIAVFGNGAEQAASPGPILCSYTEDVYFERFWTRPAQAWRSFLRWKPAGLIGFDFSTWGDWPFAPRLWSLYRSYWCTRYAQEVGLSVWPNVAYLLEDPAESVTPIPRGCYVAASFQTSSAQRRQYVAALEAALSSLRPSGILFYGVPARRPREYDACRRLVPRVDVVAPAYVRRRALRAAADAVRKGGLDA